MTAVTTGNGSLSGDFQQALDHISTAPDIPTKKKYPALKPSLDTIHVHAEKRGLPDEVLKTFIDAITRPNSFDQTSQKALITSLYPAGRVPTEIVSIVVGSLGYGASKASVPTQQLLLQWVIMVSDYLEAPSSLSQFYSVLFNLLDMTNLRADTCRLLAKITRRKHVRPFRIQMLRDLSTAVGPEPALLRLMHVYDRYAPGVLDLRSSKRFGNFPHLDPEWGLRLDRIQSRNRLQTTSADVENYVERLERVDLSDLKSVDLRDRTVQLNLALGPLETSRREIDDCLSAILEPRLEKSFNGHDIGKSHSEALESVLIYTRYTKALPQAALTFLENYLPKWDGLQNQSTALELLTYLPIQPFPDLQRTLLAPLETAILSTTDNPQITLLTFYTHLLRIWTSHLLASPPPTTTQTTTLTALANHITPLAQTLLITSPTASSTSTILLYYNTLLPLIRPPLSLHLPPPTPQSVNLLLFVSPSLSTLSGISSILASYKSTFETSTHPRPSEQIPQLNGPLIDTCNLLFRSRAFNNTDAHALGCLLPTPVVSKLAEYTAALDPPQALTSLFSLSHNPALAALSIAAFQDIEETAVQEGGEGAVRFRHAGPITQKSLGMLGKEGGVRVDWKEYRVAVLRWLEGIGVKGVRELGGATMKGLLGGPDTPVTKGGIAA